MGNELRARARAELGAPMERVAASLGCRVRWVHPYEVPEGFRAACRPRTRTIFVARSSYQPRNEFSQAHEIAELYLPRVLRETLPGHMKETFCNRVAAALLLPRQQFLFSLHGVGWDLAELRKRWPWASWGALSSRIADLVPGVAACTWLGATRASWHVGTGVSIPEIVSAETAAADLALVGRRPRVVVQRGSAVALAWRLVAKRNRSVVVMVTVARGGERQSKLS